MIRRTVLVLDDHPMSRLLLTRVLELADFDVLEAGCIAIGRRLARAERPSAVVVDIRLPDGDGLEFVRGLRADPSTSGCAILACTAATTVDDETRALAAGCDAFVRKPIETRTFPALVASLIDPGSVAV
jgi:two-component system, cell cycle response regulator DivK